MAHTFVALGDSVRAGDTIVTLESRRSESDMAVAETRLATEEQRRSDLEALRTIEITRPPVVKHVHVRASLEEAVVEWRQGLTNVIRAEQVRNRTHGLMERGFASAAEVNAAELEVKAAIEAQELSLQRHKAAWAQELAATHERIADIQREQKASVHERESRIVMASVGGTVEQLMPLAPRSVIRAGDAIAIISPNADLRVEATVTPKDVPFLREGMTARLLVEGLNTQQWGGVNAVVTSVGGDYIVSDGHPVFRVTLRPLNEERRRPDGRTARLRKGLRVQVRFIVGRKRLIDIARHRASEWMDPTSPTAR